MMLEIMSQIINIHPVDFSLLEEFYPTSSGGSVMFFFSLSLSHHSKVKQTDVCVADVKEKTESPEEFSQFSVAACRHIGSFTRMLMCSI